MANVRNMGSVATLGTKTITENGTYNASNDNVDGYSQVSVVVPPAVLGTKSITSNGIYIASSENLDGYSQVVVNVSGGTTATITVSYSSQFYNKTMTCSKGSTTYTETTTSSGVTVFNVDSSGTWTIACDGINRTVDVVLEYTTQMAITKTITIHGAKEDYITYTDATGSKVCQFASGETSKSVSITFIPNQSITFISTVAKNPDNLSENYSKTITLTDSITDIYVMPNNVLYWYGYIGDAEDCISANGWSFSSSSATIQAPTHNADNIYFETTASNIDKSFGSKSPVTGTVNVIIQAVSVRDSESVIFNDNTTKVVKYNWTGATTGITNTSLAKYSRNVTNAYPYVEVYGTGRSGKLYAMWLE